MKLFFTIMAMALGAVGIVSAAPIVPNFDAFGTLPGATFGGSGIPNTSVAISNLSYGGYNVTMGLTAHGRYSNPATTNDGAGTFYAIAGGDTFSGVNSNPNYGRWNLGVYFDTDPNIDDWTALFAGVQVNLWYDKDAAIGNDVTSFVTIDPIPFLTGPNLDSQNSWNLGMTIPFLEGVFNPNAHGEYGFQLDLVQSGNVLASSSILVNVNATGTAPTSVPDGGGTATMLAGVMFTVIGGRRFLSRKRLV